MALSGSLDQAIIADVLTGNSIDTVAMKRERHMKKTAVIFVLLVFFCSTVSCDFDPYKGKRPLDYAHSCWISAGEGYLINYETEDRSATLQIDDMEPISITFLWSALSSDVTVYCPKNQNTDDEKRIFLFSGSCSFSKTHFEIHVNKKSDEMNFLPDILSFQRVPAT